MPAWGNDQRRVDRINFKNSRYSPEGRKASESNGHSVGTNRGASRAMSPNKLGIRHVELVKRTVRVCLVCWEYNGAFHQRWFYRMRDGIKFFRRLKLYENKDKKE